MQKMWCGWLTLFCSLLVSNGIAQDSSDRRAALEHGWVFDYDEARATARKTNRPLMIVFRCVP